MKVSSVVFLLAFSLTAFAGEKKVSFSYSGIENGNRVYVSCDYAKAQVESFLRVFGASEVDVTCFGGIQFGYASPVRLKASFEVLVPIGNETAVVEKVTGDTWNPLCGFNRTVVRNLLPHFENVKVLKKTDSCAFTHSNYSYIFSILK